MCSLLRLFLLVENMLRPYVAAMFIHPAEEVGEHDPRPIIGALNMVDVVQGGAPQL